MSYTVTEVRHGVEGTDEMAKAAFEESLPRTIGGTLRPGHTTWEELGPKAQQRWRWISGGAHAAHVPPVQEVFWP